MGDKDFAASVRVSVSGIKEVMESERDHFTLPIWAQRFFDAAGLENDSGAEAVLEEAGEVADRLAPDTRRLWKWILGLQGLAVIVPMLWLLVLRGGVAVPFAAVSMAACALLLVGVCWWLRWRGMQQSWTQARMVTEIARSAVATQAVDPSATSSALRGTHDLRGIADLIVGECEAGDALAGKDDYLKGRVMDQRDYYSRKLKEAVETRKKLSRYVTMALDGALFLAVGGLVLAMKPGAERWLRLSGVDFVLGIVGALLPLVAILMQLLGSYLELNRRSGRYAQQLEFLDSAEDRLAKATSASEVEEVVVDVERELLGEVVEWYFQSIHAEPYYRAKAVGLEDAQMGAVIAGKRGWVGRSWVWFGIGAAFLGRVVFGRLLVAALSVIVTTALIAFYVPKDSKETSMLRREDGRLLSSPTAEGWEPDPRFAENGFLLIAHGLHDGVDRIGKTGEEAHWMTRMQDSLIQKLGDKRPDICLVDWHFAALPVRASSLGLEGEIKKENAGSSLPTTARGWLQDIAAIRSQGEEIGDLVGYKLARALMNGSIRKDRPMHLIGHSAGGFVVLRAALVLQDLGLAPENLRVTMLDTPLPVVADIKRLLKGVPVDYYCTSAFAKGVPKNGFLSGFARSDISVPDGMDPYTGAHSYAYEWYIRTIDEGKEEGFGRSPFWQER